MTCRTKEYRDAVRPPRDAEATLRAAAAVQLRQLDAEAVRRYLCDDAAGPVARARWNSVLAVLGTEVPAGQVLSTPLMVGLARAIYNPRPREPIGTMRDPAELCGPALADRAAVEYLLFDAFIPAAYRHVSGGRWKAQDAERWLVFPRPPPRAHHRWSGPSLVAATASRTGLRGRHRVGVGIVAGIATVVAVGVTGVINGAAWPSYGIARMWLALRRRLPWPLMGFLADAHRRGVLRQAGAVYQFRHIELQHRLANRDANEQQTTSSTA